ncbi:hypothetical protein [Agrobacterium sp. NPDC089420]|uniref:hypothetical protein n=1 Tax=Agrobacterium sp. NPDC089420 TaxID=3363918 RepID=UPI00384B53E8
MKESIHSIYSDDPHIVPDGYIDGAIDILEELDTNPRDFDFPALRAAYLAGGRPKDLVDQILRALGEPQT